MELRSFGPSNKSKIKQKTPPTNLQWLFEEHFVEVVVEEHSF